MFLTVTATVKIAITAGWGWTNKANSPNDLNQVRN
jgi:hypothetical protein